MAAKGGATPTALYVLLSAFPGVHGLRVTGTEGYGEGGDVREGCPEFTISYWNGVGSDAKLSTA